MLLALDDEGASRLGNLQLESGLAAAAVVELVEAGKIDLDGDIVVVRDAAPSGRPQNDSALARIVAEGPHDVQWWVNSLRVGSAGSTLVRLVADGVVTEERVRRFGIFSQVRYPLVDPASGRAVHERLAALIGGGPADPGTVSLLAIVHATGLDRIVFPGTDPADIQRLIDVAGTGVISDAVKEAIRHILVAVVAVMAALTATN